MHLLFFYIFFEKANKWHSEISLSPTQKTLKIGENILFKNVKYSMPYYDTLYTFILYKNLLDYPYVTY